MKKYLRKMEWNDGAVVGLWGTFAIAVMTFLMAILAAVAYSTPSTLSKSCRMATRDSCVNFGRTVSVVFFLLAICLVLGALQVCRIVNVPNPRKGVHWRTLIWAAKANRSLNPTVTRFALATSLLCAPLIAVSLVWIYVFDTRIDRGLPVWMRDCTAGVIAIAAVWMVAESIANRRTIRAEIGDWKRGVLSVLTLAALEVVKGWAGWSWGQIAAVASSAAVAIAFWHWALRGVEFKVADDSSPNRNA